jgi:hypothetical protein
MDAPTVIQVPRIRVKSSLHLLFESVEAPVDAVQTIADLAVGALETCNSNFQWLGTHCARV